jgi:hypothetical protein
VDVRYDLQRLGALGFQDCAAALAIKVLGAQVRPMGRGRDGGRDVLANGVIVWGETARDGAETWDGTTVFQVKHKDRLTEPAKDATWVWRQIRAELDEWSSPDTKRQAVPNYLVFVTNVPLTPTQDTGGYDVVTTRIQGYLDALSDSTAEDHLDGAAKVQARRIREARRDRMRGLRRWRLWDGYHIDGLLDANEGVRRAFDGFLTAGDVLADLSRFSTSLTEQELAPALKAHARWALINERNIYFDEAGAQPKGFPVDEVVIDLPVLVVGADAPERVVRYTLDRGDHVLRPAFAAVEKPRHLVAVGAPGNGKTTVSKFLVHAYRAAWLGEDSDLGDEHRAAVAATSAALAGIGVRMPAHRRWPLRVDLAKFAIAKATDSDYTLLTWISETLSKQVAAKAVPKWALWPWLQTWPSLIVLDGLDEVTEPTVRKGLINDITAFASEAETGDADMLLVVTTRPDGYTSDLPDTLFERVDLTDLGIDDALNYGRMVTRIRVQDDESRRLGIESLLEEATRQDELRHLMRTPLQVLIMTIIAETARRFAPDRYGLFWGYYQAILSREQTKTLGASRLLREHSQQIFDLHRRAGLLLQHRAETATGSDAVLTPDGLRDIAWQVLADADYKPSTTDAGLLEDIINAATQRLVLLAPQPGGGYGFDVRSLQELMAAMELTTGTLDEVIPRLRRIAASPHWRNTLLFSCGRYFSEPQPPQHEAITNMVLTLDGDAPERLAKIIPVGPQLALEIIDDGMAVGLPRWLNQLVGHALTSIGGPEPDDVNTFTRMLMRAATISGEVRGLIADGLRAALGGTHWERGWAGEVQKVIEHLGRELQVSSDVLGLATVKRDPSKALPSEPAADWGGFTRAIDAYAGTVDDVALQAIAATLRNFPGSTKDPGWETDLQVHLADPDLALITEEALAYVAGARTDLVSALRLEVMPTLWRRPTSEPS